MHLHQVNGADEARYNYRAWQSLNCFFSAIITNTILFATISRSPHHLDWLTLRWIIREIALCRDTRMYYGKYEIHWNEFANAITLIVETTSWMDTRPVKDKVFNKYASYQRRDAHSNSPQLLSHIQP